MKKRFSKLLPLLAISGCLFFYSCGGTDTPEGVKSRQKGEDCDLENLCLDGLFCEGGKCRVLCTTKEDCGAKEHCENSRCVANISDACPTGFTGELCDQCLPDHWGKECAPCNCSEHGKCNAGLTGDGSCTCDKGWEGENCSTESSCPEGFGGVDGKDCNSCLENHYGDLCKPCNCQHGVCQDGKSGNGHCKADSCTEGWDGTDCNICPAGYYDGVNNCVDCRKGTPGSSFGTDKCTFSDTRNGETVIYNVVTINNQTWMAENLKSSSVKHYSANNVKSNDNKYGYLYIWQNAKKACPSGWRLPTKDEFDQLLTATEAGSNSSSIRASSWENGSDSSGFSALPAGIRDDSGRYYSFGDSAFFWSATRDTEYVYSLNVNSSSVHVEKRNVNYGYSVRCIKDED